MRLNDAKNWVSNLVFAGYDDWRLPWASVSQQTGPVGDFGVIDCSTASELAWRDNEMGYMYFQNLGNLGGVELYGIQGEGWSGTAQGTGENSNGGHVQWGFAFYNGRDDQAWSDVYGMLAWAVRSGDVAARGPGVPPEPLSNSVPEPDTLALLAISLAGLCHSRHKYSERVAEIQPQE